MVRLALLVSERSVARMIPPPLAEVVDRTQAVPLPVLRVAAEQPEAQEATEPRARVAARVVIRVLVRPEQLAVVVVGQEVIR